MDESPFSSSGSSDWWKGKKRKEGYSSLNYLPLSEISEPIWMSLLFISYSPNSDFQWSCILHGHWKLKSVYLWKLARVKITLRNLLNMLSLKSHNTSSYFFLQCSRKDSYFLSGIPGEVAGLTFGATQCEKCMLSITRLVFSPIRCS